MRPEHGWRRLDRGGLQRLRRRRRQGRLRQDVAGVQGRLRQCGAADGTLARPGDASSADADFYGETYGACHIERQKVLVVYVFGQPIARSSNLFQYYVFF